eukprot:scaffold8514_cov74-Skeletonema_dohrnii-CCMP3373.AAC.1
MTKESKSKPPILPEDNFGAVGVQTRKRKADADARRTDDNIDNIDTKKEKERKRKAEARAKKTPEEKKKEIEKERKRKAEAWAKKSPEEKSETRAKNAKRMAKAWANKSPEEKSETRAKHAIAWAFKSPEEKSETRAKNAKRMAGDRGNMSTEEKAKMNEKNNEGMKKARKAAQESKQKFCRGHIYDEVRQLHTVWILHRKGSTIIEPVAKYLFKEKVDNDAAKSIFVRHPVDEDDKRFLQKQTKRGLSAWKGTDRYWRLGPWTGDDLQGPVPRKEMNDVEEESVLTDFPKELVFTTSFTLGKMSQTCKFCKAKGFEGEIQNTYNGKEKGDQKGVDFGCLCCKSGKVNGIKEYNLPSELDDLYTNEECKLAQWFRKFSRIFNNGMAMASVVAEKGFQSRCYNKKMESMLTAGGQLLRRIGPLEQKQGNSPRGAQCIFYGPEDAAVHRTKNAFKGNNNNKDEMNKTIFTKLHRIIVTAKNKYVESFLSVKEYVKKKRVKGCVRDLVLAIHANVSTESLIHQGRLNAPRVKEVALLMPNEIRANEKRFLLFNYKEPDDRVGLEFIPDYHRSYDPLQYPLLFPDGRDGWHFDLDHTLLEHINFMMMDRDGITNPILCGKSLGQQFILDQYCKVELERLRWVELNQKTIRAELYSGLGDSVKECEDLQDLGRMGKKVILPSTFTGGERYMHQQYLDSMAMFQKFGRPHLFITGTANPNWKEIKDALKTDQTAFDRPDLVARVFKLKKQQLIRELQSECIFGKYVARTHSIEFQKRGLPHVHVLVWLEMDRHFDSLLVDDIICAEIPEATIKCPELDDDGNVIRMKDVDNPVFQKVTSSMLHGPCGDHNPTLSCMCGGFCKYNYPKDYVAVTELNEDGYPRYRRRSAEDGGEAFEAHRNNKKYTFTNADVIPYNKYLTQRFDCHINVEYCHSISAIKYLFGYISKGCDQATVEVQAGPTSEQDWTGTAQASNEVLEYQTKRYVSVAEGCWRLRKNEIAERKPAVFRMNVHLPEQQTVYYNPDDYNIEDFEHKVNMKEFKQKMDKAKKTPLTEYFANQKKVNSTIGTDETEEERKKREENTLLFRDMPDRYTWDAKKKCWKERKRGIDGELQIGRVYTVHPTEIERYSLRLLLNHVKGKESFEDLRTVDNKICPTFHAAAIALNLVKNDKIWIECMNEANDTQTNINLLRRLFVTILLNCQVGDPEAFYEACSSFLCTDYLHQYKEEFVKYPQLKHLVDGGSSHLEEPNDEGETSWTVEKYAQNSSLIHLQEILQKENRSLATFHLPEPDLEKEQFLQVIIMEQYFTPVEGSEFTKERAAQYFNENFPKLNKDQLHVFDTLKKLLEESIECSKHGKIPRAEEGTFVFLDAPGGTGKTFTLNVLISWIVMNEKLVAASAASGIAATMLHNGRTAHNHFKLPINITQDSVCNITKQQDLASFLRDVLLIIIDEATMLDRYCYECLDRTLQDLTDNEHTRFGGKTVLVSGDFRQLLEVIPGANRAKTVDRCLKGSQKLWDDHVIHLKLRENMRVKNALASKPDDSEFKAQLLEYEDWLLKLGEGALPNQCQNIVEIPPAMCRNSKDDVVDSVFDNFESNVGCSAYYQSRAIVTATNEIVNEINDELTDRLPGELQKYHSIDTVGDDDNPKAFPSEFLNSLQLSGMADHKLHLKENSVVILLRNIDIPAGHCNGTRYFVKRLGEYRLVLKKLKTNGDKNDILILPRIPMTSSAGTKLPFVLNRLQFPIKVAFALTINRSQSQTFSGKCGILLPKSVWTHGQIYVTFSRCGDPNNVYVWADQEEFKDLIDSGQLEPNKVYMRNVVYKEVISESEATN